MGVALYCAEADLRARESDARRLEWEANDFATELLMPRRLFAEDVAKREASFRTVASLAGADMYDVSLTAAAWRLTETTREACALVVSCDGQVEWIVRSDAWRFPLAERSRPLPAGSMAEAVARGEAPSAAPEAIDPAIWLTGTDGRMHTASGIELLESTHAVPRMRQVLSLLWVVDEDA
ncbi:MAG: ImmA/IrrE family metallo-endopeptidase [Gemmatimonadaceae bacterium]